MANNYQARLQEIKNLTLSHKQDFLNGISVIIPTFKGEEYIKSCLLSLYNQTLDRKLFEVIFIVNGEKDNTESIIKKFIVDNRLNNILIYTTEENGASLARNIGIEVASRKYTLFLDDDDYLSSNFLEEVYKNASKDTIIVTQIANTCPEGKIELNNPVNKQIMATEKEDKVANLQTLSMVTTISACKLIPTEGLKMVRFDPKLKSGEDIVFFTELYLNKEYNFKVLPLQHQVIYYRLLRKNSVSRQDVSFDFNVTQRLDVIKRLDGMLNNVKETNKKTFIKQKINAQFSFVTRYLEKDINEKNRVYEEISKYKLSYIPFTIINRNLAKQLVVSYCFPPYVDTSGNVMAKRIRKRGEIVDVIYNKMDRVRTKDNRLNALVNDLIDKRIEVPTYSSFSSWKSMEDFVNNGIKRIDIEKYNEVYSRAMWPASHFLAYKLKQQNPNIKWIAEFSDPLLLDIHGKRREAVIDNKEFLSEANESIKRHGYPVIEDNNLFLWCEYLPYIFADELVFTNKNQMKYMIEYFPLKELESQILSKAVIAPQPTLPKDFYTIEKSKYKVDENVINIAYFGSFYSTRNLEEILVGLENTSEDVRKKIRLHVFTGEPNQLQENLENYNLKENIIVNPYVHFLEFLNLATKFDCLIVNDAKTLDNKSLNPYLPSKLSDYTGSGTKIWGLYEDNSILSQYPLDYKSPIGNIEETTKVYNQIVSEFNTVRL